MLPSPYDLVIGLDRSDKKADLCIIDIRTGPATHRRPDTAAHLSLLREADGADRHLAAGADLKRDE